MFVYICFRESDEKKECRIRNELENLISEIDVYNRRYPTKKMINIPVYYINMDIHVDRRNHIEKQLLKYASGHKQRIKGFNGYEIKNTKNDKVDGITFYNDYDLTKAEIGCTLSHLIAIKTAYYNGDEIAIIIEDDTNINLIEMIDDSVESMIEKAPLNFHIIKLFYMNTNRINNLIPYKNELLKNYSFFYEGKDERFNTASTVGYLINREGMKRILNHTLISDSIFHIKKENGNPYSGSADIFLYNLVNTYNLYPSLFFPNNVSLQSTIHDDHTSGHILRSIELLKYYSDRIKEVEFSNFSMHVVYINLDKRIDRDNETKIELDKIKGKDVTRIPAVEKHNGAYGCLLSHYKALEYSINYYPEQHVLVCEDDIEFLENPCFVINDIIKNVDWDVIMIANNTIGSSRTNFKNVNKVIESQTCSCYLVHSSYRKKLMDVFKKSIDDYELTGKWIDMLHCSDQCWKSLQLVDNWYIPSKKVAKQRKSYSDIEKKIVDYLI